MGTANRIRRLIQQVRGVTYIEVMIAISILAICMVYIAADSSYSARAIRELNETDRMLYAAQEAIERYKLDGNSAAREINGYSVEFEATSDPVHDPNLLDGLCRVKITVQPKDPASGMGVFTLTSYAFSDQVIPPNPPSDLVATASIDSITLNWDYAMYADSYIVKRSEATGGPYTAIAAGINTNNYTDTTASVGTTYYYVVTASNAYGESTNSNEANATIIINITPANLVGDSYVRGGSYANNNYGTNQALFFRYHTWTRNRYKSYLKFDLSEVTGIIVDAKLRLYGFNSTGGTMEARIHQLSDDSWTEGGITWNNAPLEGSVISTVTFDGTRKYVEANVKDYCISELAGDKLASFVITTTQNELGDVNSKEAAFVPQLEVTWTPLPPPPAPQNLTAEPGDTQIFLDWDVSTGAESYNIKRSVVSGGPYSLIDNISGTEYTDSGLTNGTTYYYVVSAVNGTGESADSNQAGATPNILVTVTRNSDADAYVRDGSYANVNFGSIASLDVKSSTAGSDERRKSYLRFNLADLNGEIISTKLRLYGGNIEDGISVAMDYYEYADNTWEEDEITFNNAPVLGTQLGSVTINNVQTYREIDITDYVKAKFSGDKFINIAIVSNDVEKLLSFNSKESLTNKPELVIVKTLTKPSAPAGLTAVPDDMKVTLNWSGVSEADNYTVKRSTIDGGPYTAIQTGLTSTAYEDNTVSNGTTYYYVVSAVNASGEGGNSNQASATPNPTINLTLNPVADARVEQYNPGSNFGTESSLSIMNNGTTNKKSYLRFDLSGYTNNAVSSAKLRLYGNSSMGSYKTIVYGVSDNTWPETGICWGNAPALEASAGSAGITTGQQYYEIDITQYISERINQSNLISMGVYTDVVSGDSVNLNSREAVAGKPELFLKMVEGVPKPPRNLTGIGGNRRADLSWEASDGAVSYKVKRSTTSGGPYTTIAQNITATSYQNTGLTNGRDYYYVVTAVNARGESINSNEVCVIPGWGPATQTLMPSDDTYVRDGAYSDSNFGSETAVNASKSPVLNDGNNRYIYIKFDGSALSGGVTGATLKITGENATANRNMTLNIYKVSNDSWDEYSTNWNNQPGNDILLDTIVIRRYSTYSIDITDYVVAELAGDKQISICIKSATNNYIASFDSLDGANPPLLQIAY